jgi:hypothetical protein
VLVIISVLVIIAVFLFPFGCGLLSGTLWTTTRRRRRAGRHGRKLTLAKADQSDFRRRLAVSDGGQTVQLTRDRELRS